MTGRSTPPSDLSLLLRMYERAIEESASLPKFITWTYCRPSKWPFLGPFSRLPRMTLGVSALVIRHVESSVRTLERRYYVMESLEGLSPEQVSDRDTCTAYRASLPPSRLVLTVVSFAIPATLLASILIHVIQKWVYQQGLAGPRLTDSFTRLSSGLIELATGGGGGDIPGAIAETLELGARGALALVGVLFVTAYVIGRPFVSAFRLKRHILSLSHQEVLTHRNTASSWFVNKSVGAYAQERKVHESLGSRWRDGTGEFDVTFLMFPVLCMLLYAGFLGLIFAQGILKDDREHGLGRSAFLAVSVSFAIWAAWPAVLAVLRITWLRRVKRSRKDMASSPPVAALTADGYVEARPETEAAAVPFVILPITFFVFPYLGSLTFVMYPVLSFPAFYRLALTEKRLTGRPGSGGGAARAEGRGISVLLILMYLAVAPVGLFLLLWRLGAFLEEVPKRRRYQIFSALCCPAMVLFFAISFRFRNASYHQWQATLSVACIAVTVALFSVFLAVLQRCQNELIEALRTPVPYGCHEGAYRSIASSTQIPAPAPPQGAGAPADESGVQQRAEDDGGGERR